MGCGGPLWAPAREGGRGTDRLAGGVEALPGQGAEQDPKSARRRRLHARPAAGALAPGPGAPGQTRLLGSPCWCQSPSLPCVAVEGGRVRRRRPAPAPAAARAEAPQRAAAQPGGGWSGQRPAHGCAQAVCRQRWLTPPGRLRGTSCAPHRLVRATAGVERLWWLPSGCPVCLEC